MRLGPHSARLLVACLLLLHAGGARARLFGWNVRQQRYQVQRTLGQGGMGRVDLALDSETGQQVAIKHVDTAQWAQHEFNIMSKISPDASRRYRWPRALNYIPEGRGGAVVMQYVNGLSLCEMPKSVCDEDKVVRITMNLLRGVRSLHRRNVIHGDIKPDNVMINKQCRSDSVCLVDFSHAGEQGTRCSPGTLQYAAPEQFGPRGKMNPRVDVFGVGATAYQLLTGRCPFGLNKLDRLNPPAARSNHPIWGVIRKAMSYDPQQRYGSAQEMLDALRPYQFYNQAPPKPPSRLPEEIPRLSPRPRALQQGRRRAPHRPFLRQHR